MDKNKNVIVEATLVDYKVFKYHDITATILKLKNEDDLITGLFVDEYSVLIKNNKYKIRGNIIPIKNIDIENFNQLMNDDIKKYIDDDKLFCITAIEKIDEQPLLTSIEFSLLHNDKDDLIDLKIPMSAVEVLEIGNISKSISYLSNGRYHKTHTCSDLVMRLIVDELDKDTSKLLLEDICLFYISLSFEDGEEKYYNLPFYSKDDERNYLQKIEKKDNKIIIHISNEFKYKRN